MGGKNGRLRLTGRVAIVTDEGSLRGIGRATASRLAQEGADIVVGDLDLCGAEAVAGEVRSLGRRSIAVRADVTSEPDVAALVRRALEEFGRIDILVNNAGITQPKRVLDITVSDWDRVLAVNLKGTFLCSKSVLPTMLAQGYGRIVNLSSVSAKRGGGVFGGAQYSPRGRP